MEQINNKPGRQRRNGQQIVQILKDFEQSGISVKEFCLAPSFELLVEIFDYGKRELRLAIYRSPKAGQSRKGLRIII